jgi:GNAT superfamily N-acetyltransferase
MSAGGMTEGGMSASSMTRSWRVRAATAEDVAHVASAVAQLLTELGGEPPALTAMQDTARALIADRNAGVLLVAEASDDPGGAIVGVLAASAQLAMHAPGRYLLIQDLWVDPAWRSQAIGSELLTALAQLARERRMTRLEVGLPRESFSAIRATEAFYLRNSFTLLGVRMRQVL